MRYTFPLPVFMLVVYLATNVVVPFIFSGEMIFLSNITLWATVIALALFISKSQQARTWRVEKAMLHFAAMIAIFQIFLTVFLGFFMGFSQNTNVWTPSALVTYFPYLLIPFLAMEISRGYLSQTASKRKPTLALILISLFYTFIALTISTYASLTTPLAASEFLIKSFIPTLAINLVATYLAFLGGATANLTYMAIPSFFTWFSPILPSPPWAAQSIITVIATTIGFLILDQTVKPLPTKRIHRTIKKQKSQLPYWTAIALIGLIAVWSSTGLLGFTPTIIASGSMRPTLNPGDITVVISAPSQTIKIGDVIQYHTANDPIIHRVIDKYETGGSLWFVTKGDANNAPDEAINERQVIGKAVFTIPKLGWVSVALKDLAANTYTFLTTTLPQTLTNIGSFILTNSVYITSALAFTSYSYLLLTCKNRKKKETK